MGKRGPVVAIAVVLLLVAAVVAAWWTGRDPDPTAAGRRLVSLSPPITETLYAIGAGDLVVGRSAWDLVPPEVQSLPNVGTALSPDLEAIARLEPTLILTEATNAGPVEALRRIAPTTVLRWLTVDDAIASTRRLGFITGHEAEAEALAQRLRSVLGARPPDDAPTALVTLGADEIHRGEVWYIRSNSIHGAALAAAGLRNAVERPVHGDPRMGVEELIELDPDLILVLVPGEVTEAQRERILHAFDALEPLTAVRSGAIEVVAGDQAFVTGPSVLDLVERLREAAARATAKAR